MAMDKDLVQPFVYMPSSAQLVNDNHCLPVR